MFTTFLLNTIYISSHGTTKYNANNVLCLSGHTSFPHDIHESLVVECSLIRVLLYGPGRGRGHSGFQVTGMIEGFFSLKFSIPRICWVGQFFGWLDLSLDFLGYSK